MIISNWQKDTLKIKYFYNKVNEKKVKKNGIILDTLFKLSRWFFLSHFEHYASILGPVFSLYHAEDEKKISEDYQIERKDGEPTCLNFMIYNQSEENRMIHQIMSLFLNQTRWNKCDNIDTNKQSTKVITAIKFYSWPLINIISSYVWWIQCQISIVTISSLYACVCIKKT